MNLKSPLVTAPPKCQISRPVPTRPDPSRVTRYVTCCVTALRRFEASEGASTPLLGRPSPTTSRHTHVSATQKTQKRQMRVASLTYPQMPPRPLKCCQGLASFGLECLCQ